MEDRDKASEYEARKVHIHLLPHGLLLRQRTQRLVERVRNDCTHGLAPRPFRVDLGLPKQVIAPSYVIVGRFDLAGREDIGNDPGVVRVVGVNPVGVDCGGIIIGRAF